MLFDADGRPLTVHQRLGRQTMGALRTAEGKTLAARIETFLATRRLRERLIASIGRLNTRGPSEIFPGKASRSAGQSGRARVGIDARD